MPNGYEQSAVRCDVIDRCATVSYGPNGYEQSAVRCDALTVINAGGVVPNGYEQSAVRCDCGQFPGSRAGAGPNGYEQSAVRCDSATECVPSLQGQTAMSKLPTQSRARSRTLRRAFPSSSHFGPEASVIGSWPKTVAPEHWFLFIEFFH